MMKKTNSFIIALAAAALLSSCSHKGWSVEGKVNNASEGAKISVEGFNAGMWYNIDSVSVASDGRFAYAASEGSPYPEIYRIALDGKNIYFPIDSIETIKIIADAANFDTDYEVSGSDIAVQMMEVDKRIAKQVAEKGAAAVLADSLLKRELSTIINDDQSGILGYYIINKTIGDAPLYSVYDKKDVRIIGALANKFMTHYPDDPRTQYLCARFLQARSAMSPVQETFLEAKEAGLLDIELYDPKGQKQKLSDLAAKSGVTLLSFTSYLVEPSIPYNVELNRLFEKYRANNIGIYQISVDTDEVQWRNNALRLPWTAVWYDGKDNGSLLNIYNVSIIPTTFVIDRNGDLVERVEDPAQIEAALKKHL